MAVCAEADRSRDINSAILHFDGPGPSFGQRVLCLRRLVSEAGSSITCLDQGPIVNFNVTSGQWLDGYDPDEYSDYGVHEKIHSEIGGDSKGGATATAPADGWSASALEDIFGTKYDTKKIKEYWPYTKVVSTGRPRLDSGDNNDVIAFSKVDAETAREMVPLTEAPAG